MIGFIIPQNIRKQCAFVCEQHHINENISINCVIVYATRGYINAANLWGSGSSCIHHSTTKCTKLIHFMLKGLASYLSHNTSVL